MDDQSTTKNLFEKRLLLFDAKELEIAATSLRADREIDLVAADFDFRDGDLAPVIPVEGVRDSKDRQQNIERVYPFALFCLKGLSVLRGRLPAIRLGQ